MNSKIKKSILLNSVSFWLDLDIKTLEKRLKKSKKRPLLNEKNLGNSLKQIYKERKNTYAAANYKINCSKLNINLTTDRIIKLYANN